MSFCSAIFSKFLDQYIEKIDKNQVKVSLVKGHVELHNVSFTPNFLASFGIPLIVKESHADQIVVDFPSMMNNNQSAYFCVTNVDIFATIDWSILNKSSINSVADLVQSLEDEKKATKSDKKRAWNSWIEKVIDNSKIDIKNVRLHIEFDNWNQKKSSITLFFESLLMNTIDSEGKIVKLKQKPLILRKRIKLTSFSIDIQTDANPFKNFSQLESLNYNFLSKSSFTLVIVHDRSENSNFFNTFTIVFDPIFFYIRQDQFFALQNLLTDFSKSRIRQKFESCMKPLSEKLNQKYYIKMWSYFYRCAVKIRRPHHFSPTVALNFLKMRKEYAKGFIETINQKQFVKKSIKNHGEELTFLLIQYSSIQVRRKKRMINLDQNEINAITSDDLRFFSNDSFQFNLNLQGIGFELHSFLLMSVNDINFLFEKKGENIKLNIDVQNWIVDDVSSNYKVIQTNSDENNFINFKITSRDDPAVFDISKFKIDLRSSFLKKFSQFFVNNSNSTIQLKSKENNNNKISKRSSINEFLIKLNPKTLMKFKIYIRGFSVGYSIDDGESENSCHSFHFEIKHIGLKNFSKNSTVKKLQIKSKMLFGEMEVDKFIISEQFSFKSSTTGIIDEYYYLSDLTTNLDILKAKIDIDSSIIDILNNILKSITNNTQNNQTKIYSSHKIYANCSDISILVNSDINTFILSISGVNINPSIEFKNISIIEKSPKIIIPSLCFNKWPIIETDLLNINLNSYEFFDFLDEVNWITNQITKLTSSFIPTKIESEEITKKENINVIAHLIDYKMGDRANSMKFKDVACILDNDFIIKIGSFGLLDSSNQQFLFCENEVKMILNYSEFINKTSIQIPDLKMNFLWNEISQIIEYFQDSRNLIEENFTKTINKKSNESIENLDKYQNEILLSIGKSTIDIENSFILVLDNLKFEYLISSNSFLSLKLNNIDIDNLLEVNKFIFQISDFIYDISIESINANLSQSKALKISELSFLPNIFKTSENNEINSKQIDLNVNIKEFSFIESSTNLKLIIPLLKFTINSYNSIGALHIPSINFENVVIDNIQIFLLFNSKKFNCENIESVFLLERKETNRINQLTNIIIDINSINFEYAHYFVMRIFNAYKIYSKYSLHSKNSKNSNSFSISLFVDQININETNLKNPISLSKLSFVKDKDFTELKCKSFNFVDLLIEKENSNFLFVQKNTMKTDIKINPFDVYLNINTMKKLSNIYESLLSLIKTDFNEKIQREKKFQIEKQSNFYNIEINCIQIHFPFEDDPTFLKHDLTLSFELQIQIESNSFKKLNIKNMNLFFTNIVKKIRFLHILSDASFSIGLHNNNDVESKNFDFSLFEIEIGLININVSALDIFELQQIVNNFIKSFNWLMKPKTFTIAAENKPKKFIFTTINSKITINPISISLCEENRASTLYNQIFTLNIEAKNTKLNLQPNVQSFMTELTFSILNMNLIDGKSETFMLPTIFSISYSNGISETAYFGLSVKTDIDFNFTSSSFQNFLTFVRKFQNKEKIMIFKNESKFNYKPEYWIQNNLDDNIIIQYKINDELNTMIVSPNDHLPICELDKKTPITFIYKEIRETISIKNIIFPIYFENISVSTVSNNYLSKSVVFNSPLSIQNKLDCNLFIYIKLNTNKQFVKYAELPPEAKFPLPFEERQYFIYSDFEKIFKKRKYIKKKNSNKLKNFTIDSNQPPEPFSLSLNKIPKIIKIQNIHDKKSVSFNLNVNDDHFTNTRVCEINPSLFIHNLLPCPIFSKINNSIEFVLQSNEEQQINLFNHDNQTFSISLSFDSISFNTQTVLKLDNESEIFAGNECTAIQIQKILKTNQKKIAIFAPCVIFNNTNETITYSPSSWSNPEEIKPNTFAFYGLKSYSESEKSMKIDLSIEKSQKKLNAIDCMQLNSNCTTVYLPRDDNPQLFYPLNVSITLGQFPMNATHVVTFTQYLYVINNLPFDFSLVPIISNNVNSIDSNFYNNIDQLLNTIEMESQSLLKDSFYVPHSQNNLVPIKWVSKSGMFLFSASKYPTNPIIQLDRINRTIFLVKNKKERIFIELNIYEDKSTLYAYFQVPSFPVPLVINNSLDLPICVYQNIRPTRNKLVIEANTSSLFAFSEPFINNKQICIEISKANKNADQSTQKVDNDQKLSENKTEKENTKVDHDQHVAFLFSMEEQLSPLISEELNFIITTTVIGENNSRMIQVRRLDETVFYESSFRGFLSIYSIRISLNNDQKELALFTMKEITAETSQDDRNTFLTLSIQSIQIDNQNTNTKIPVCIVGADRNFFNANSKTNSFISINSIFPRGVPLFTVINFMSIQIQPILIVPETSMIILLSHFFKELFKRKNDDFDALIVDPSFKSVTTNKTMIAYLEIHPINFFINIPNDRTVESYYVSTVMKLLNMVSLNKVSVSVPKLFVSEFNNNFSYLIELLTDFYGSEVIKQITKNTVFKMVANSLISFKQLNFVPLSKTKNLGEIQCDNRKPIFSFFNEIELNDVSKQSKYYFDKSPEVIDQLLDDKQSTSNILVFHPNNQNGRPNINSNKDRLIIGIQNDPNSNINSANTDLLQVFKDNNIKRVRIPSISPIYSSFEKELNHDEIYLQIQSEILKDKKLETQNIRFIIKSKENSLYCVTDEMVLFFSMEKEVFQITQQIEIIKFNSILSSNSIVSLKSDDQKIGQIDIQFDNENDADLLLFFVKTQQKVISIFGHAI